MLEVEGVETVIISEDFKKRVSLGWPVRDAHALAYQKVRYVGDSIAVVAAETPTTATEGEVGLSRCLEWVRDYSDWKDKKSKFSQQNKSNTYLRGGGVDYARTTIVIARDHTITLQSGLTDYRHGSRTVFTLVASQVLGVAPERIYMLRPNNQTALESGPTVASRDSIVGGMLLGLPLRKLRTYYRWRLRDS